MSLSNLVSELNRWIKLDAKTKGNMPKKGGWSDDEIKREATKYHSFDDWRRGHPQTCSSARAQGRLKEFCKHMPPRIKKPQAANKLSANEIQDDANKYQHRSDWKRESSATFMAAYRLKGIDFFAKHMTRKPVKR